MRAYRHEKELREIAENLSATMWVRTESGDIKRRPTKRQKEALYSVLYGALLGLNWGEAVRKTPSMEQAIVDSAEFTADVLLEKMLPEGEVLQGYMTIYCPLKEALRNWETV